jgi:ectoine hydroxylase-related dioxygenase (phytanoyl-CoA dioxygenase family)
MPSPWPDALQRDGFAVVPSVLSNEEIGDLIARLDVEGGRGGSRVADQYPEVRRLARSGSAMTLARQALGDRARPVRILFFDKKPGTNWSVPYHQDLTIAVRERAEVEGYRLWTVKAGVPHVQAPAEVLERMVAVRLHLDPCGEGNGPLRVLPGTHGEGKLDHAAIEAWVEGGEEVTVTAERGAAILMKPLLLHASSPSVEPSHRRVLHIEYAAVDLPEPLRWNLQ